MNPLERVRDEAAAVALSLEFEYSGMLRAMEDTIAQVKGLRAQAQDFRTRVETLRQIVKLLELETSDEVPVETPVQRRSSGLREETVRDAILHFHRYPPDTTSMKYPPLSGYISRAQICDYLGVRSDHARFTPIMVALEERGVITSCRYLAGKQWRYNTAGERRSTETQRDSAGGGVDRSDLAAGGGGSWYRPAGYADELHEDGRVAERCAEAGFRGM